MKPHLQEKSCYKIDKYNRIIKQYTCVVDEALFSSPGGSPGRAIVLPLASALVLALSAAAALAKSLTLKFFDVMGKALSGELSCPCDRFCFQRGYFLWKEFAYNKKARSLL